MHTSATLWYVALWPCRLDIALVAEPMNSTDWAQAAAEPCNGIRPRCFKDDPVKMLPKSRPPSAFISESHVKADPQATGLGRPPCPPGSGATETSYARNRSGKYTPRGEARLHPMNSTPPGLNGMPIDANVPHVGPTLKRDSDGTPDLVRGTSMLLPMASRVTKSQFTAVKEPCRRSYHTLAGHGIGVSAHQPPDRGIAPPPAPFL
ncbi:hypothetical protein VTJ04DRAFT_1829 [Mycothermus thermophilus]|uniref:uncharacterized protein n=1 Tax=Humicola insolens TaxID=85995 RepID=UPI003743C5F0